MKNALLGLASVFLLCSFAAAAPPAPTPPAPSRPAPTPAKPVVPVQTITAMRGNAEAVERNASGFLWKRVNLEVYRIIADEKVLELTPPVPARRRASDALRQAVLDLRSASQDRDSVRTIAAARRVADNCTLLLK